MEYLPKSLAAWPSGSFPDVLKGELEALDPAALPLQQGLSHSSYAVGEGFKVTILGHGAAGDRLEAKVGVFYAGVVAGCSCADDPTPVEPMAEYCELLVSIDKATAEAGFRLI